MFASAIKESMLATWFTAKMAIGNFVNSNTRTHGWTHLIFLSLVPSLKGNLGTNLEATKEITRFSLTALQIPHPMDAGKKVILRDYAHKKKSAAKKIFQVGVVSPNRQKFQIAEKSLSYSHSIPAKMASKSIGLRLSRNA